MVHYPIGCRMQCTVASSAIDDRFRSSSGALGMALRPSVISDQDTIDVRLTGEAEYRIPFTFIEALNEGTLFDRPAHAFLEDRKSTRLNSSHVEISYAVFCLKKKKENM